MKRTVSFILSVAFVVLILGGCSAATPGESTTDTNSLSTLVENDNMSFRCPPDWLENDEEEVYFLIDYAGSGDTIIFSAPEELGRANAGLISSLNRETETSFEKGKEMEELAASRDDSGFEIINLRGTDAIKTMREIGGHVRIIIIPDIDGIVSDMFVLVIDKSVYESNSELFEAIISSVSVNNN